jgi:hypothetical protein
MASFSWSTDVDGNWNTGTLWTPATEPNDIAADVTIDAAIPTQRAYTVSIQSGTTVTVHSLTMNDVNGRAGTNNPDGYFAAYLRLNGTLAFAPGSDGALAGPLQTYVYTDGGASAQMINPGTLNAFIQVSGDLLMTGTNGIYITNEIQALGGTITIDTKTIAEMTGNTLFDGIFEAKGPGAVVNLGGARQGLIVNVGTLEGPSQVLVPGGWTELYFGDPDAQIMEWNGTRYVSVETTLTEIGAAGTVDVLNGRDYTTTQTLTIDAGHDTAGPGMLNLQAGKVTTGGININGGVVQGYGQIASGVVNNGTMIALGGATNGTLEVTGTLSGTGAVLFDQNIQSGSPEATKGTLVLHGVSAGQTVTMNSGDKLVLATPQAFAGTIVDAIGGTIVLQGITATSAMLNNGTLVVSNGASQVAALAMSGNYSGDAFTINGSIISLGTTTLPPPPPTPGQVVLSGASSQYVIANDGGTLYVSDTVANRNGTQTLPGVNKIVFTDGVGIFDPTGTAENVARLYQTVLDRAPDAGGLQAWTAMIDHGNVPLSDVANMFAASPEFIQGHGNLSDQDFVNQLYENGLGRAADAAGRQYWTDTLASGASRGTAALGIAQSPEAQAKTISTAGDNNNGEVYRIYETTLARAPDAGGGTYWASTLSAGGTVAQVAQGFVQSAEFQQDYGSLNTSDFVTALYQNSLHRSPDANGLQYWTAALQGGMSQATAIVGFADSLESRAMTSGATHANWVFINS